MKTRLAWLGLTLATVCLGAGVRAQRPPDHAITGAYTQSLGIECSHCHVDNDLADASKPTFDFARRMARMVGGLNEGPLKALGGISCWSCHRGRAIPARIPRADWESLAEAHAADFTGGREGLGLSMGVYAASLGVECSHCHFEGRWADASKPAHAMVAVMSTIFDLVPTYFDRAVRTPRTQCYMCHHGQVRVERRAP
jgi:Photosynthetic reaction centre cytochrome C subunit